MARSCKEKRSFAGSATEVPLEGRSTARRWWKENVVYQIYPRSFCDSNGDGVGDLNGIRSKLGYLKELGIHILWLSPVYKSPNDDNGYDIADYRAIMDEFGTMEDFDALLEEAHQMDIKIVMDLVVNHTSDEHQWFAESRSSRDNDKRDYYIWREAVDGHEPNNWGSCFSGSAWEWDETTGMYYLHCFSKKQPDLNWENPKVRDEVFDMMTWWCDKGIDGFRMDVISMISKKEGLPDGPVEGLYSPCVYSVCNGPHVHEYLQEMNRRVLSKYDLMTVGETAGVTVEEAKKYANADGTELSMVFQFEHVGLDDGPVDKWCTDPMSIPALKENLTKWEKELEGVAWNSLFFCNHDQPRMVSRLGDNSSQSAKCIATVLHFMQGTPYVYQGEELGMTNCPFRSIEDYRDIESINAYWELTGAGLREPKELLECIAYKSRDNARTPMQWDDSSNAGFTTGQPWIMVNPNYTTINAATELADPNSVFYYYKNLIALRQDSKWSDVIVYGSYDLLAPDGAPAEAQRSGFGGERRSSEMDELSASAGSEGYGACDDEEAVFAYTRKKDGVTLLVVCNLSAQARTFPVPENVQWDSAELVTGNVPQAALERQLALAPWQAAVWALA